jgi:hypothetical protein
MVNETVQTADTALQSKLQVNKILSGTRGPVSVCENPRTRSRSSGRRLL